MEYIAFEELYGKEYRITGVIALYQRWRTNQQYTGYVKNPRPNHGVQLYLGCGARYSSGLSAKPGDVVYLPEGSTYEVRFCDSNLQMPISNYLVNFELYDTRGNLLSLANEPLVISPRDGTRVRRLFADIFASSQNVLYPPMMLHTLLYELLTELSVSIKSHFSQSSGILDNSPVSAAVEYILENCLKEAVRVKNLAALCHMSEANFRRVFEKYHGVTPKDFINGVRLERARTLLSSGVSVSDTARSVGFEDISYFIRFFGKHAGMSPGSFARGAEK